MSKKYQPPPDDEKKTATAHVADWASTIFSAVALIWFFYSYVLEVLLDLNLYATLKVLECPTPTVNWGSIRVVLGKGANYTVTEKDLNPYVTPSGIGYDVNGTYVPPNSFFCNITTDVSFLNFFIVAAFCNLVFFGIIAFLLTCYKFSLFMNCKVSKQKEKHANNVDRALGVQQLATVIFSASKILVYMSLLNKFIYYKMWDDVNDFFTLNDFGIPVLFAAPVYVSVADIVKGTVAKTGFNIFRTYWLFQAIYFAAGDGIDLFFSMIRALIIMLPATLVWTTKSVSDIAIFHYTQRIYSNNGDFTIQPLMIISIINICSGSAGLLTVFYYNVMTVFIGKKYIQLCFKNIKILSRILFAVSFVFVLVCIICVVVLWIKVDKSLVSAGFFYAAFGANLVLVIVTLVGLIKPDFYQYVVLRSLGRDVDRFDLQKKDPKEENLDL